MATVVLQVVGAAIGGAIGGPVGATIGRAAGAVAGYAIDQKLFSKDQVISGGRLDQTRFLASLEGTPVPRVYGRVKTGGQLIWATRFEEVRKRKKRGGKGGGSSVTTESYRYFANFAVGICQGPVSHVGRIWADGEEIDRTTISLRIYLGTVDQEPDPLIEALQGAGKTPAFRGTAYAVFEDFPLANYGNRIPQITFEVIRSVSAVDRDIRAVTLIPGAGEFAYAPLERKSGSKGTAVSENRHVLTAASDWEASLNELQALCPNLERVSLVVAWFGTDLRAGNCQVEPRCVHDDPGRTPWQVSGLGRNQARLVSRVQGAPAYGGTPSDQAVLDAIADLKARGLKVSLYPFLMMDIPPGNALPDPYGAGEQAAFPWRGRITCNPAIGQPSTADQTPIAAQQISAFMGTAVSSDFEVIGSQPVYQGTEEWSYRRMILHCANLCRAAGGVERFLIGSEMPALTRVRDETGGFPFVSALVQLAADVNAMLGGATDVSYAADWSEYFGYHPQDGTNDLYFNLDPLWASPDIAAVAIDNYMPISDWKENGDPDLPEAPSRHSLTYLRQNITAGEGMDWYYASLADRIEGNRTPITDGMGEPWVWSFKALREWWLNFHHERVSGQRKTEPTAWLAQSKPVWFSEIGCPAVDRGANQPNVFLDEKSSESALPWHSRGGRDDLMQLRYLQAMIGFWRDADNATNPLSGQYAGNMIDPRDIYPWAWDARPFPAFPQQWKIWNDGGNWYRGHWLNGRLGTCPIDDLLVSMITDMGFEMPLVEADGHLDGYLLAGEFSPRQVLEPLIAAFNLSVTSIDTKLAFTGKNYSKSIVVSGDDLVQEDDRPALVLTSEGESELASQISLAHGSVDNNFDVANTSSRRLETSTRRQHTVELPAVVGVQAAETLMNARLQDHWAGRNTATFSLATKHLGVEPGDTIILDGGGRWRVQSLVSGIQREVQAVGVKTFDEALPWRQPVIAPGSLVAASTAPLLLAMNLPLAQSVQDPAPAVYFAAFRTPWTAPLVITASQSESGFEEAGMISEPSLVFELEEALMPGPLARWDNKNTLLVRTLAPEEEFASMDPLAVLSGSNAVAIESAMGEFEIVQFHKAELTAPRVWRLSGLLRGQMGTWRAAMAGAASGALGTLLDNSVTQVEIPAAFVGLERYWRIGPANRDLASDEFASISHTCTHASKRPMTPVHLKAVRALGHYAITWIRQTRTDGDNWNGEEVPLDYSRERYRIEIRNLQGLTVRQWETAVAAAVYQDSDRQDDIGSLSEGFLILVAQMDDAGLSGPTAECSVNPG